MTLAAYFNATGIAVNSIHGAGHGQSARNWFEFSASSVTICSYEQGILKGEVTLYH